MDEYICLDCEERFDVDINVEIVEIHCPKCGSEDVMELEEYLKGVAINDEDDYREDMRLFNDS